MVVGHRYLSDSYGAGFRDRACSLAVPETTAGARPDRNFGRDHPLSRVLDVVGSLVLVARNLSEYREITNGGPLTGGLGVIYYPRIFDVELVCIDRLMQRKIDEA